MSEQKHAARPVHISCPDCKKTGTLVWEAPPERIAAIHHYKSEIQELSEGFAAVDFNERENPRIICQTCKVAVEQK